MRIECNLIRELKDKKQNPIKSAIGQHPAENSTSSLLVMEPRKKSLCDVIQLLRESIDQQRKSYPHNQGKEEENRIAEYRHSGREGRTRSDMDIYSILQKRGGKDRLDGL